MADLLKADPNDLPPQGAIAQLRAHVWQSKKPQLIDASRAFEIPEFDIEIDIDLENSQEALREAGFEETMGRDSVYLYGYGIHDRTANKDWKSATFGYFDDYRDSDEAEFSVLSQMWQKLKDEVAAAEAAGKTVGIFHYSPHERTWWRNYVNRHSAKPGSPFIEEVNNFMAKYFVDLYPLAQHVALPVTGYSIKVLAPLAGFEWEVKDAGGGNSIVYYQTATSPTKSEGEKAIAIKWLREYNRDDVKATFAARAYLRKLAAEFNAK
jgi:predicted RecB family nuclease